MMDTLSLPPLSFPAMDYGQWWQCRRPFRHFRAMDVLPPEHYHRLASVFSEIADTTAGKRPGPFKMTRGSGNYDALMLGVDSRLAPLLSPFFSEEWIRSLSEMMQTPYLPRIDGGLHSSPPASRTGWIHTDYCSAWFDESRPPEGELLFPCRSCCEYFTGQPKTPKAAPKEYARAATLIYYLGNDGWRAGDGGETSLYSAARQTPQTETDVVPPINNTALLFECSPHSYHRFLTNPGRPRNSLILWLHSTLDHAESRWGASLNRRGSK